MQHVSNSTKLSDRAHAKAPGTNEKTIKKQAHRMKPIKAKNTANKKEMRTIERRLKENNKSKAANLFDFEELKALVWKLVWKLVLHQGRNSVSHLSLL